MRFSDQEVDELWELTTLAMLGMGMIDKEIDDLRIAIENSIKSPNKPVEEDNKEAETIKKSATQKRWIGSTSKL